MRENFLKDLPKGNFHLHLTGSLFPHEIRQLAEKTNIDLKEYEPLEKGYEPFENPTIWSIAKEITSTEIGLLESLKIISKREREDNVIYTEITINPFGMMRRGMHAKQLGCVLREAAEYGKELGIYLKFKFGVNRKDSPLSVEAVKDAFLNCPEELRCTVDLNGDELRYPTSSFVASFLDLHRHSIPTSIHAGEHPSSVTSLRDAMQAFPQRIAHAIAALESEELLHVFAQRNIKIEMAYTSNVRRKLLSAQGPLPYAKFLEYDITILPGTDDPAFFASSMSDEYSALMHAGVTHESLVLTNHRALAFVNLT